MAPSFKQKVHAVLCAVISEKTERLNRNLADLRMSAANETKSTAGDKYETALAMLQAEQDRINKQLQEMMKMQAMVEMLDPSSIHDTISPGSLVETDSSIFYISAAGGKISVDDKTVITLSPSSPLGQKLCGLSKGGLAEMNGSVYTIRTVC